jgi:hypothetical protein
MIMWLVFFVFFAIGLSALTRLILWPFRVRWPYQSTVRHAALWRKIAQNYWLADVLTVIDTLFAFFLLKAHSVALDVVWVSGLIVTLIAIWKIRRHVATQFYTIYPETLLSLGILYHWMTAPAPT